METGKRMCPSNGRARILTYAASPFGSRRALGRGHALANRLVVLVLALVVVMAPRLASAEPLDPKSVPEPLKPWTSWALHGKERSACPRLYGMGEEITATCAWPAKLELSLDDKGGRFTQAWHLDARGWIPLPGDDKRWPLDVRVKGASAAVVARDGVPSVLLDRGDYTVTGSFAWDSLPDSLRISPETALLALTVRGVVIAQPNRDTSGVVWLQKTTGSEEGERLDLLVFRRITDDVPLLLTTRVVLNVAGKSREVLLGKALPPGFLPVSLDAQLPARVEPDSRLRVQVRPGTWTLELVARSEGPVSELSRPLPEGPWREGDEVWVFDARPTLRLVEVEGVSALDPQQTSLPDEWKRLPAYPMKPSDVMKLVEKRRGDAQRPPDQLTLSRTLWLDFDGAGFTASDIVKGRLSRASRLEMAAPTVLGRVSIGDRDQFITQVGDGQRTGVEVRQGELDVSAESRIPANGGDIPAVGWDHDFHQVSATLHVPLGWRLVHASGVDDVPSTWIKHWSLLEIFLVLIIAIATGRLYGVAWGALALVTLALVFPEADAPRWVWVSVLVFEALCRVTATRLPRTARVLTLLRAGACGVLVLVAIPFIAAHVRGGMYPALAPAGDTASIATLKTRAKGVEGAEDMDQMQAVATPAPPAEVEAASPTSEASPRGGSAISSAPTPKRKLEYRQFNAEVYDPSSVVQTGPGKPRWEWTRVPLSWSGPVAHDQRLHLYLLSPSANLVLAFLRAVLLVVLVVRLLPWRSVRWLGRPPTETPKVVTATIAAIALFSPGIARADVPSKEVLEELAGRLLAKPTCAPRCSAASRMVLEASPGVLRLRLDLQSTAPEAVPLPGGSQWTPETVLLDGKPASGLLRTSDGRIWLSVPEGSHQALLEAKLGEQELVQIALPLKPHRVEARISGYRLEGVHEDGLADDNLQLTRLREGSSGSGLQPGFLPPFVRVERTLLVGLNWQVQTRVVRLSKTGDAVVLEVPLLAGESVTTADVRVQSGKALVNLPPQSTEATWSSTLDERSPIALTAPKNVAWTELWRLDMSPIWHADIQGIPVVHAEADATIPEWRPWPGETTTIDVTRPAGVAGQTVTIDEVRYDVRPGLRATDATLSLDVRSSRGAQQAITIPEGAQIESVKIAGKSIPARQEGRRVIVPLSPGPQAVELSWRGEGGIGTTFTAPEIELGAPSVNVTTSISMTTSRWVLLVRGPRLGPAVVFWSFLLVMLAVSWLLGRVKFTPLRSWQWMLLAIGLSQVHIVASAMVVLWLLALGSRKTHVVERPIAFNARQVALVVGTVAALAILIAAVHQGLLGTPEMQIRGNDSSARTLFWFEDRTEGVPSSPWVLSLPLFVYRLLMLGWALWLALSILSWLKWGYGAFTEGGAWRTAPTHAAGPQGFAGYSQGVAPYASPPYAVGPPQAAYAPTPIGWPPSSTQQQAQAPQTQDGKPAQAPQTQDATPPPSTPRDGEPEQ